jgi:hypothetical protein
MASSLTQRARLLAAAAIFAPLALVGCGIGTSAPAVDNQIASISGQVHGGQSAIQGAIVTLYHTSTTATAYGAGAVSIGTGTTDANGEFTIGTSATASNCPAGDQAYITAAGGYQTGQKSTENQQSLELVALGDCNKISASTSVVMNEVTTVVAGYALGNFITFSTDTTNVDGLGNAVYAVSIGAPVANNAATATPTTAAGLNHAFLNATNLVSYSTGMPNATFSAKGGTNGEVPVPTINALGNAMQYCVDSATGSTTGGTAPSSTAIGTASANCASFFADTLSIKNVTPTNTLQAAMYLARNPYTAAGTNATSGLLSLVASSGAAFIPAIAAVPADWSMVVYYHDGLYAPYFVALDQNDTAFAGLSTSSASTPALFGVSAYGTTVPTFASQSSGTTTRGIAPDALGNIWLANSSSSVDRFYTSDGTLQSTVTSATNGTYPVAIDRGNNMWVGHNNASGIVVEGFAYSAGTGTGPTYTQTYTATATNMGPYGMAFDANENLWFAGYYNGGTAAGLLANVGTATAPSYAGTATMGVTAVTPITTTFAGSATKPYSVAFDATGNAWYAIYGSPSAATTGIDEVIPNTFSTPVTSITSQAPVFSTATGTTASLPSTANTLGTTTALEVTTDGAGTLFIPDNSQNGLHMYSTVLGNTLTETKGLAGSTDGVTAISTGSSSGAGCTSSPTVTITGGGGSGATATATISTSTNKVTGYTVVTNGTGYTSAPTVTDSGGGCTTTPTATAYMYAIYNPRQVAIDSTGSAWMGFTTTGMSEVIGIAAPAYPLLSIGKPGLAPGLTAVQALP